MPLLTIDFHNTIGFRIINRFYKIFNAIERLLYINICQTNRVEVLYFIVNGFHLLKSIKWVIIVNSMRQQSKSKTPNNQLGKGGAVPTLTHRKSMSKA